VRLILPYSLLTKEGDKTSLFYKALSNFEKRGEGWGHTTGKRHDDTRAAGWEKITKKGGGLRGNITLLLARTITGR